MTLLPVLRPADWPGAADARCRRLLAHPDPMPWVAVARVEGGLTAFVGRDAPDPEPAALDALAALPVSWRVLRDGDVPVALIEGEHAAERVLDEGTLWRLGETELGARALAVAIPRSGLLLATALAHAAALAGAAADLCSGPDRLTDRVLVATDGKLSGVVTR